MTVQVAFKVLYSTQAADNPSKVIRVLDPLQRLAAAGVVEPTAIEPQLPPATSLGGYRAVFLHVIDMNTHSAGWLVPLLQAAKRERVAVICDTDDPYLFGPDGYRFDQSLAPHLELRKRLYAECDVVTVTTEALKDELAAHAGAITVIPNLIDMAAAPQRAQSNQRVRIGWCGGPTHADDLAVFAPAIARLQRTHPIDFTIFGMFDRNFDDTVKRVRKLPPQARAQDPNVAAFGRMADALAKVKYDHVPSVPFVQFMPKLAQLDYDIGVCPLLDTRFNRCRSAIKFYQYAATNTVTVASDVQPYRGACSLLIDNTPAAWADALEQLIRDPAERQRQLEAQRAYVSANRSWQVGQAHYERLFSSLGG